jgi:hypothetical protein
MDERVEWQMRWLEEAVARVRWETGRLALIVVGDPDLIAPLKETALVLVGQMKALREALDQRELEVEEEVATAAPAVPVAALAAAPAPRIPAEGAAEISLAAAATAAAPAKSKSKREKKHEAEEDRPQAGQDPPRPGDGCL